MAECLPGMHSDWSLIPTPCTLTVVAPTCNLSTERLKQQDQKSQIILDYIASSRPARVVREIPPKQSKTRWRVMEKDVQN